MISESKKSTSKKINSTEKSSNKKIFVKAAAFLLLSIFIVGNLPSIKISAAGTITGRVFQDFNGNGNFETTSGTAASPTAVDVGIAGVTVTAYDSAGTARGTIPSGADGVYTLNATGTGPYRIEFTGLPAGFQPSARSTDSVAGGTANNSGSTVQFVPDGTTANVNLAVNRPEEYCQNNPNLATCRANQGAANGTYAANPAIQNFAYNSGTVYTDTTIANYDNPTTHSFNITASSVGSLFGLAYSRLNKRVYAAAFFKRYVGFGPGANGTFDADPSTTSDEPGAIYVTNPATNTVVNTFTVPNTGINSHDIETAADNGNTGWDAVGKTSLGGIALADDESRLYAMNLQNRTLYALNPTTGANLASQAVPTPANCPAADVRPFAVKFYRGNVYVGMVCSAESNQLTANLRAYVYQVDPTTLAFGATPYSFPLNYNRGFTNDGAGNNAEWRPWIATIQSGFTYTQPMLTDIDFTNGNLVLSIRDRAGDQELDNGPNAKRTGGDTLRACGAFTAANFPGTLTLEANGRCGGTGTAPQDTGQGPGNTAGNATGSGEFYFQDDFSNPANGANFHDEVSGGSTVHIPGHTQTVTTVFDPISRIVGVNETFDGGTRWFNNTSGASERAYRLYNGDGNPTTGGDLGKVNGLGDVIALCDSAPIELGNRVWRDANGNGVQDAGESGIGGVTVRLYNASNAVVGIAVTDANGEYYFVGSTDSDQTPTDNVGQVNGGILPNSAYQVRFDRAADFTTNGALNGLAPTTADSTAQAGDDDANDSDAANVTNPTNSPTAGTFPVISVTTGASGANNHTLDAGFQTFSLGNRIWFDTNNNGAIDGGEVGAPSVSVSVFLDANNDNTADNLASPIGTTTTDATGYYRFDNLLAGNYIVRVNPVNFQTGGALVGYQNSTATETDPDANADSNDNGLNPASATNPLYAANGVLSNNVVLGPLTDEPTGETDLGTGGQGNVDNLTNLTVDFGFYRLSLSGTLWSDNGGGIPANSNNGILDAGEPAYSSLRVQLYDAANVEIPVGPDGILGTSDDAANGMFTNGAGNYNFQGLPPGTYRVVVTSGGATSSTPTEINPDGNVDNDDNGFPDNTGNFAGKTISGTLVLTPGGEPSVTNVNGTTANSTVDFGFILSPTVVRLDKFDAFTDGSSVELQWSTGSEAGNLGFNVYREVNGKRRLLNSAPIAGNALRSGVQLAASGSDYIWTDKESVPNAVYYLEDLDVNGGATLHGAVTPQFRQTLDNQPNAKMFSDLANAENSAVVKEIVGSETVSGLTDKQSAALTARQQQIAALGGAKITVSRDGWYRVSAGQLQASGFDTDSNPQFWQLYADGAEVPFKLNSDSIEFFGRATDTPLTDKGVYYLINGQENGLRVNAVRGGAAGETADARSFAVKVERRDRAVYLSAILNGDDDNWFGAVVSRSSQTVQNLTAVNVAGNEAARLSVKLQGIVAVDHLVKVRFNDVELGTVEFDGFENKEFEFDLPTTAVREGVNGVYLQSNGASNDASVVDSIRLSYRRNYTANNNRIRFSIPANQSVRVGGFTDASISVYEIRGGAARQQVVGANENSNGGYGFSLRAASADREMIAVVNSTVEGASATRNAPSSWNSAANQADFVIVTADELRESADNLAAMREAQGLKTKVVLVEDLFDEFSFGRRDPNAVKQFLKTAATEWKTKPNYALLFGDASYDTRNNLGLNVTRDIVPTKLVDTAYMETSSDSWLADFDNDDAEDIALGRLPIGNASEAAAAVAKLARFDAQDARQERINVLVADSGFENYSQTLQTLLPRGIGSFRIDRGAQTDAETHQRIVERLNANPLLVTYTGHGSQTVWATSGIFNSSDAAGLSNSQLSFYLLMNCLNGYTHQPTGESLGESLLKSSNGAVAVWTSSGITQPEKQAAISQAFTRFAFGAGGKTPRVGDVVKAAKRASDDADVRRTWHLIGDPTVFVK